MRAKADTTIQSPSTVTRSQPRSGRPLLARRQDYEKPRQSLSPERLHELPSIVHTLAPIRENTYPFQGSTMGLHHSGRSNADMRSMSLSSLPKPSSPATTYIGGSTSSPSYHSETLSRPSSRTFSPPPFPSQDETTDLPEVVEPLKKKVSSPAAPQSIRSDNTDTSSSIILPPSRKWPFKSRRGLKGASKIPSATFYTSGRTLLLWNDRGACTYNLKNSLSLTHHIITAGDIVLAAGGTRKVGVISRNGPVCSMGESILAHSVTNLF